MQLPIESIGWLGFLLFIHELLRIKSMTKYTESPKPALAMRRTTVVVDAIKTWIVENSLAPNDRLPGEKALIEHYGVSKGTIREAMRVLEAQGIIQTKTGPGGGCFVAEQNMNVPLEALGHYFYFHPLTMADVYQLRKLLEPELAASAIPYLDAEDIEQAKSIMRDYSFPAQNRKEWFKQLVRSIDFYDVYVEKCPNVLLSFYCRYLHTMLKELTTVQLQQSDFDDHLRRKGFDNQLLLLEAMRAKDVETTRRLISTHMTFLHQYMEKHAATLDNQFLQVAK
ncbi:FadR/GntR family transcriptional regulator [Ostreibacterium oceani]|nr:GntR family transcriptional regulator [Ostreibacterium oceani]